MRAGIKLRGDFSALDLRRMARESDDADQTRRLLSIAVILDGGSRSGAARTGRVGLQVIRDWVLRFNEGGPEALRTRKAPGKSPILTDEQRQELAAAVEAGPKPYLDGVVRWCLVDLVEWVREEFGVTVSRATLGRELRAMGFRDFRPALSTMRKTLAPSRRSKKLPRHGPRDPRPERLAAGRDLVSG